MHRYQTGLKQFPRLEKYDNRGKTAYYVDKRSAGTVYTDSAEQLTRRKKLKTNPLKIYF